MPGRGLRVTLLVASVLGCFLISLSDGLSSQSSYIDSTAIENQYANKEKHLEGPHNT